MKIICPNSSVKISKEAFSETSTLTESNIEIVTVHNVQ